MWTNQQWKCVPLDVFFSSTWLKPRSSACKPNHSYKVNVWGGISYRRLTDICVFPGITDSKIYQAILEDNLLPFTSVKFPDGFRLYQVCKLVWIDFFKHLRWYGTLSCCKVLVIEIKKYKYNFIKYIFPKIVICNSECNGLECSLTSSVSHEFESHWGYISIMFTVSKKNCKIWNSKQVGVF